MDIAGQAELLDEGGGVFAQVGRKRLAGPHRQQALAEKDRDGHASGDQRDAHEGELEIAEPAGAGVLGGLEDQHVHRRAGQRQHRARMRAEDQRHQHLRRRTPQTHGHDHDHRQERRDGAVDADQRGKDADHQHHQDDQPRAAVAGAVDQDLSRPGRDAGPLEPGAHDEQRSNEDRRGVPEAGEALVERENAGRPQGERATDTNRDNRQSVPHEQHDHGDDDCEYDPDIGQITLPDQGDGLRYFPHVARRRLEGIFLRLVAHPD